MATPPSQAKTKSSQAKTKKRRPAADDPPTPGSNDPLLAELRETTTQRLSTLLAQNAALLSDLGRLNSNGVDTGTVFGRALKRARGLETLVPPPPPPPERRRRTCPLKIFFRSSASYTLGAPSLALALWTNSAVFSGRRTCVERVMRLSGTASSGCRAGCRRG